MRNSPAPPPQRAEPSPHQSGCSYPHVVVAGRHTLHLNGEAAAKDLLRIERSRIYSTAGSNGEAPKETKKPRVFQTVSPGKHGVERGSYRDRTDDIHGVNVALYQLS